MSIMCVQVGIVCKIILLYTTVLCFCLLIKTFIIPGHEFYIKNIFLSSYEWVYNMDYYSIYYIEPSICEI